MSKSIEKSKKRVRMKRKSESKNESKSKKRVRMKRKSESKSKNKNSKHMMPKVFLFCIKDQ